MLRATYCGPVPIVPFIHASVALRSAEAAVLRADCKGRLVCRPVSYLMFAAAVHDAQAGSAAFEMLGVRLARSTACQRTAAQARRNERSSQGNNIMAG